MACSRTSIRRCATAAVDGAGPGGDHVRFIGFISRYVTEHRSTRAATELLFSARQNWCMAGTDALITLLDTEPSAELRWTRDANPQAYDLIVDLRRYYHAQLERKGLASSDALESTSTTCD